MHPKTVSFLLDLNRQFYHSFARSFSATRQRIQPGVARLLLELPLIGRWLDLGCGNGELGRVLAERGFQGEYVGLDFSEEFIEEAMERGSGGEAGASFSFYHSDLSNPHWSDPFPPSSFDRILAFSALHHLPGLELRLHVLRQARLLLKDGGLFVHSEWQFQHSPRLAGRVQPWERLALTPADLEEGDFLLDWRAEKDSPARPPALRYVHRFSLEELSHLADQSGFEILQTFESDGQGGRLGLYQVWKAV